MIAGGTQIDDVSHLDVQLSNTKSSQTRDGRFGSKMGQIGPKWDKSGAISDQISVHLPQGRQMH